MLIDLPELHNAEDAKVAEGRRGKTVVNTPPQKSSAIIDDGVLCVVPDVLAAQGDTIRVLHTLRPVVVVMAGENEVDPYKDE